MVAIVSGNSLGISLSSLATLGNDGVIGQAAQGASGEQVYVNAATGNLVVRNQDDFVPDRAGPMTVPRTYNSQGLFNDDNADNWSDGIYTGSILVVGVPYTQGSEIIRTDSDGAQSTYTWNGSVYTTTDGGGANDTIKGYGPLNTSLLWVDGDTGSTEEYDLGLSLTGLVSYRLTSYTDGGTGATINYSYSDNLLTGNFNLSSVSSEAYGTIQFKYSDLDQLTEVHVQAKNASASEADTETTTTRYTYDALNRLSKVSVDLTPADNSTADGNVYETTYTYVGISRELASITQTDGTQLNFTYVNVNGTDRVASVTDALGQVTSFSYDPANSVTTVTDPLGLRTTYKYDGSGQLTGITSPSGTGSTQSKTFTYDASGNVTRVVDGESHAIDFTYDANGNQTQQRDSVGNTVQRVYDSLNQLTQETLYSVPDPDGAGSGAPSQPQTTSYYYNPDVPHQLRFTVSQEGRVTEYRYDSLRQLSSKVVYDGNYESANSGLTTAQLSSWAAGADQTQTTRSDYAYDLRGNLASTITYTQIGADGTPVVTGNEPTMKYAYDIHGRLVQSTDGSGGVTSYAYDGLGRVISTTDASGQTTLTTYSDANDSTTVKYANGLTTITSYDKAGRVTSISNTNAAAQSLGATTYAYDKDGRLLMTQDPTGVRAWRLYDDAGNVTADIDGDGSLTEYTYNRDNQVTSKVAYARAVDVSKLVDSNGRPTAPPLSSVRPMGSPDDQTTTYQYDKANRLAQVNSPGGLITQNVYDGQSRLVATIEQGPRSRPWVGGDDDPFGLPHDPSVEVAASRASVAGNDFVIDDSPPDGSVPIDDGPSIGPGDLPPVHLPPTEVHHGAWGNLYITRNFYGQDGELSATMDKDGMVTFMSYDAGGRLVGTTTYAQLFDPAQPVTLDALRLTPSQQDIQTHRFYNAAGQLSGEIDGEGYLTEYVYDANGNVTKSIRYATRALGQDSLAGARPASSPSDHVDTWSYDAMNRVVSHTDPYGVQTLTAYDSAGNVTSTTVKAGGANVQTLTHRYDAQGRLTGDLGGEGSALLTGSQTQEQIDAIYAQYGTTYAYDNAGRRISSTDADGSTTLYFYNNDGQLAYTVNALGEVQETQYNALNQVVAQIRYGTRINTSGLTGGAVTKALTDQAGARNPALDSRVTYTYTVAGKVATSTDALGNVTTMTYDAFGDMTSRVSPLSPGLSLNTQYQYDHRGALTGTTVTDMNGNQFTTSTLYDAFGNAYMTVDANGSMTRTDYDHLGRVVSTTDALGRGTRTTYDAFDRVLTQTDAAGKVTTYTYDDADHKMTLTTPEGVTTSTVLNALGQVQTITDGNGNQTVYHYDRDGNMVSMDTSLSHTAASYDRAGHQISTTDADGNVTNYTYDAVGRVLTRTVDAGGLSLTTQYQYDAKGETLSVTDPAGVMTQYSYDADGRVLTQAVDPNGLNLVTTYSYDAAGDVLTVTTPGGLETSYVYDEFGRRTEEHVDPNGKNLTTKYYYDNVGHVVMRIDPNGNMQRYLYDAAGQMTYSVDAMGNVVSYAYDADGRMVEKRAYPDPVSPLGQDWVYKGMSYVPNVVQSKFDVVERYVYDGDGHLRFQVDGAGAVQEYRYDGNGNVTETIAYANRINLSAWDGKSAPPVQADAAHDQHTWTGYDALNRAVYSVDGTGAVQTMKYDGNGNVTERVTYANRIDLTQWNHASAPAPVADPARDSRTDTLYDDANRAIYSVSGNGALVAQRYDADGRLVDRVNYANTVPAGTALTPSALAAAAASIADATHDNHVQNVYDSAGRLAWSVNGLGGVTHNSFDAKGNLIAQTAYATPLTPGAQPSSVTASADDRTVRMAYDSAGRMEYQLDANGAVTQYAYDGLGNVVRRTAYATPMTFSGNPTESDFQRSVTPNAAADRSSLFTYDADGRQSFAIDPMGAVTETRYDAFGHVAATIAYANPVPTQRASASDALAGLQPDSNHDRVEQRFYDVGGNLKYKVDALGYVTQADYDGVGRMIAITDYALATQVQGVGLFSGIVASANDQKTTIAYDADGRVLTSTDALGHAQSYTYDGRGQKLSYTDRNGATWNYAYDASGNLVRQTSPAVAMTTLAVGTDANGGPNLSIDAANSGTYNAVTQMTYDAFGNVLTRTEAVGRPEQRTTSYGYDAMGHQVSVTFAPVGVYDAAADNLLSNGAAGNAQRIETTTTLSTQTVYDVFGDAVMNRDVAGNTSFRVYDQKGSLRYAVDAEGDVKGYQRNVFGDAVAQTAYSGKTGLGASTGPLTAAQVEQALAPLDHSMDRTTTATYDNLGRTIEVREPQSLAYNGTNGVMAGATTRYKYDAFGATVQVWKLNDAVNGTWAVRNAYYDKLGRETASVDALGYLTVNAYDAEGNVTTHVEYANAASNASTAGYTPPAASADDRVTTYTYDLANRKTTQTQVNVALSTDAGGGARVANLTMSYGYDAVGNQTTVTDAYGAVTTTAYDALGRVTSIAYPARADDTGATVTPVTEYRYDAYGNIVAQIDHANGLGDPNSHAAFKRYDSRGNEVQAQDAEGHDDFTSYDASGRTAKQWATLSASNGDKYTQAEAYRYDRVGNVVDDLKVAPTTTLIDAALTDGNTVGLAWRDLVDAGGGAVQMQVDYVIKLASGALSTRTATVSLSAADAATGARINLQPKLPQGATLDHVATILLSQSDASGQTRTLWQSDADYPFGTYVVTKTPTVLSDTHMTYDAYRELTGRQVDGGLHEYWAYDAAGHMWHTNQDDGVAKAVLYDAQGNITSQLSSATTDLSGLTDETQAIGQSGVVRSDTLRDALGNAVSRTLTQANGATAESTQTMDRWGNVIAKNDPLNGKSGEYFYNALNEKLEEHLADAAGNLTLVNGYAYDNDGRLIGKRDQDGATTTLTYDAAGDLITETKSAGAPATQARSGGAMVMQAQSSGNTSTTYAYDAFGNQTTATDQSGQTTVSKYDADGHLVEVDSGQGTLSSITYDEMGRPQRAQNLTPLRDAGMDWSQMQKDIQTQLNTLKKTTGDLPFLQFNPYYSQNPGSSSDSGSSGVLPQGPSVPYHLEIDRKIPPSPQKDDANAIGAPQPNSDAPPATGGLDESGDGVDGVDAAGSGNPSLDFPDTPSVGDVTPDELGPLDPGIDLSELPQVNGPDGGNSALGGTDAFGNAVGDDSGLSSEDNADSIKEKQYRFLTGGPAAAGAAGDAAANGSASPFSSEQLQAQADQQYKNSALLTNAAQYASAAGDPKSAAAYTQAAVDAANAGAAYAQAALNARTSSAPVSTATGSSSSFPADGWGTGESQAGLPYSPPASPSGTIAVGGTLSLTFGRGYAGSAGIYLNPGLNGSSFGLGVYFSGGPSYGFDPGISGSLSWTKGDVTTNFTGVATNLNIGMNPIPDVGGEGTVILNENKNVVGGGISVGIKGTPSLVGPAASVSTMTTYVVGWVNGHFALVPTK